MEAESAHLEHLSKRVSHSVAGALHAINTLGDFGYVLAYVIAGHHAGLPDWQAVTASKAGLKDRLASGSGEYADAMAEAIPADILEGALPEWPAQLTPHNMALWMRMLFSCLVDADFLDTEHYMSPEKTAQRQPGPTLAHLQQQYQQYMATLVEKADKTPLQALRQTILQQALAAANQPPGMFSLTVPTGGGKTLASLGFALQHAIKHDKKRIIYAIPYTSIIEQNAEVFRRVFTDDNAVLEHHSNLDNENDPRARLATENWDAPLVVTTTVQLFESLHASRTSRCRKLHNLADSIIILDEAQQLPRDFHEPITRTMQQLTGLFGVSWVLCTATQPELTESRNPFGQLLMTGLDNVREIMADPAKLSDQLNRVEISFSLSPQPWSDIAAAVMAEDCVLCIVNTRQHARELFEQLSDQHNAIHLSAHMCAEHRSHLLQQIRHRLEQRRQGDTRPLRVISTQLIEAGVDVDFPVVFRAMAGLDSIAQAAGRCNREGKLPNKGRVWVFTPDSVPPPGMLAQGAGCTRDLLESQLLDADNALCPASFSHYFKRINSKGQRDKHGIVKLLTAQAASHAPLMIQFREAADKFRLIDDSGVPVVVPYCPPGLDESPVDMWVSTLESDAGARWIYRKLQRYTVTIPEKLAQALQQLGALQVRAGLYVLLASHYDNSLGVMLPESLLTAEQSVL